MNAINSVEELLATLGTEAETYQGHVWFRGHADSSWTLSPGYYRLTGITSEATLLKRFRQSAAMLVGAQPAASFDWLFLMQHYGVPTRLLDWSESPLVALYFAVNDTGADQDKDGALWILRPSELNRHARINNKEESAYIPSFEDDELRPYGIDELDQNRRVQLLPVATIATRNNPRIQAQLGVFTIHHSDKTPIEKIGDGGHVAKYVIPASAKKLLAKQLALLGFSRFQLFPELASVGALVRGMAR